MPLAEVITCAGFFIVCFLEELIHHFIHPHKKPPKSKPRLGRDQKEFERYDMRLKESLGQDHEKANDDDDTKIEDNERTKSLLRTVFVVSALSFHSVIEGLALTMEEDASGVWINFAAVAMHKFVIAFSLGVELITSKVMPLF